MAEEDGGWARGERPTPKQQWTKDVQSLAKLLLEETTILDLSWEQKFMVGDEPVCLEAVTGLT